MYVQTLSEPHLGAGGGLPHTLLPSPADCCLPLLLESDEGTLMARHSLHLLLWTPAFASQTHEVFLLRTLAHGPLLRGHSSQLLLWVIHISV